MKTLTTCLVVLALSGCMTIAQTAKRGPKVYAGTRYFFKKWPTDGTAGGHPVGSMFAYGFIVLAPFDLPLSFVLDTAMLPVTIIAAIVD